MQDLDCCGACGGDDLSCMPVAELEYIDSSEAAQKSIAETYVGLSL